MASILAVDVALFVPTPLRAVVERLNQALAPAPRGFYFDETHLPHITLAQLFVSSARLNELRAVVTSIADGPPPLALDTAGVSQGRTTAKLRIAPSGPLSALHRLIMEQVHRLDSGLSGAAAFHADGESARPEDVTWVERYRMDASGERYDPHVTLGVGEVPETVQTTPFVASQLGLCHLGRFCTCRRVLAEWTLTA